MAKIRPGTHRTHRKKDLNFILSVSFVSMYEQLALFHDLITCKSFQSFHLINHLVNL